MVVRVEDRSLESRPVIIGAGIAGLAAAYELAKRGQASLILERADAIGGLARTYFRNGCPLELGPHILFKHEPRVTAAWKELLGEALKTHRRRTKLYFRGRYVRSPLNPLEALLSIGPLEISRCIASYLAARLKGGDDDSSSAAYIKTNYGERLYELFFRSYNSKIWGLDPSLVSASWAQRRVRQSLPSLLFRATSSHKIATTAEFDYPSGGVSQLLEAMRDRALAVAGAELRRSTTLRAVHHDHRRVVELETENADGVRMALTPVQVLSTLYLDDLVRALIPAAPADILGLANRLRYRHLALVVFRCAPDALRRFQEHWVDVHDDGIRMLRVTNFGTFAAPGVSSPLLAAEYVCQDHGPVWSMSDSEIIDMAASELTAMRLVARSALSEGEVLRVPRAYPVYYQGFERDVADLRKHLSTLTNLQSFGRTGMYKYNNMHHSFLTGLAVARTLLGEPTDPWSVDAWHAEKSGLFASIPHPEARS